MIGTRMAARPMSIRGFVNDEEATFTVTGTQTDVTEEENAYIQPEKFIRDGRMFIRMGDKTYDMTGRVVR